jgi:hypothetical protein
MTLNWNEIKTRAVQFAADFSDAQSEREEAQTFWNHFFEIFGIERRRVAVFESKVKKLNDNTGFIDLLWPGVLLVEHKSLGEPLAMAQDQAENYFIKLKEGEHPRFILVCDFQNFWLKDLDLGFEHRFTLKELAQNISLFGFLRGQQITRIRPDDPINDRAVKKLSRLHNALLHDGFVGHPLQLLLVRLLFCMFADKTGLFEPAGQFTDLIENGTLEDGSNVGPVLNQLFCELDTKIEARQKALPGWFKNYPFVNGYLFQEKIRTACFDTVMRELLLDCCHTDWGRISPAIFGSMFQHIMDAASSIDHADMRRELGAHYTSEDNIQKLIGPLFLDELRLEFESIKGSQNKLFEFQKKLRSLRFLDPACGCGNFLVITYRELRTLELDVLRAVQGFGTRIADLFAAISVNVDQFSGIEIEEFPARVAQVAMWLMDHQMNCQASDVLQQWFLRLPLLQSANIRIANALDVDWAEFCPPESTSFILGNPPFIGKQFQSDAQKRDMERVVASTTIDRGGLLDYVAAWYIKATQYLTAAGAASASDRKREFTDAAFSTAKTVDIFDDSAATGAKSALSVANDIFELAERQNLAAREKVRIAFVSTSSICQGEQVGVLWSWMLKEGIAIEFAHRTFKWRNEATGNAAVHCVIVGFGLASRVERLQTRRLFDYAEVGGEPHEISVKQLNPYLVDAVNVVLPNRRQPICDVPAIVFGSMPNDGGHLLLNSEEKTDLLTLEPGSEKWLHPFLGAKEFINQVPRWCLWLKDCPPNVLSQLPHVKKRVMAVKAHRLASSRESTRRLASSPSLFGEIRQPVAPYLLIPRVSSERRKFIPIGFLPPETIASDATLVVPDATPYHFGILSSTMQMAWMRYTCGRLEIDFRYSAGIVYNNFPWPEFKPKGRASGVDTAQAAIDKVANAAQAVLDARAVHAAASLAEMYGDTMPENLQAAHKALDKAVDAAYGFKSSAKTCDADRVAYLFDCYAALVLRIAQESQEAQSAASETP